MRLSRRRWSRKTKAGIGGVAAVIAAVLLFQGVMLGKWLFFDTGGVHTEVHAAPAVDGSYDSPSAEPAELASAPPLPEPFTPKPEAPPKPDEPETNLTNDAVQPSPPLPQEQQLPAPPVSHEQPQPADQQSEERKLVALTFDDGPDGKYTPQILDLLKEHQAKATFFVVGRQIELFPDVLKRIHEEGHAIGNHSMGHAKLTKLTADQIREEIVAAGTLIESVTGEPVTLFRAPYGSVSPDVKAEVETAGSELVGWSVDPKDWAGTSPDEMLEIIKRQLKPGGNILLHSFGGKGGSLENTLEALPVIIEYLRQEGYTLVTVPELQA